MIYLTSKGVTSDKQKVALIHTGGIDFQDVYYTLVSETEEKAFAETIKTLDDYFTPKANATFERHFCCVVDQFVCRLQQKAVSCEFGDVDEAICDQLIDCCRSSNLRRKFLEKTGTVTLKNLQDIAQAMEALDMQVKSMRASCNVVDQSTWEMLKEKGVKCQSEKCDKRIFAYGQTEPIAVLGVFKAEIYCPASKKICTDEFTVVKGSGKNFLGKSTAEELQVLRVGPPQGDQAYSITVEGNSKDILEVSTSV